MELYRWIKASERLPGEKIMEYGLGGVFIRNTQTKHGGMTFISDLKKMDHLENVEWLEKIELPNQEEENATNIISDNLYSISDAFGNRLFDPEMCDHFAEIFLSDLKSKYILIPIK